MFTWIQFDSMSVSSWCLPQDMSVHFALTSCRVSWAWLSWVEEVSPEHNRQQILRLPKFWVTLLEIQENGNEPQAKASPRAGPQSLFDL